MQQQNNMMDRYHAAAFANSQFERELAMSMLMNAGGSSPSGASAAATEYALNMARFGAAANAGLTNSPPSANSSVNGNNHSHLPSTATTTATSAATTNQEMLRLQCELLNREIATRNAFAAGAAVGAAAALHQPRHPSLSTLLAQQTNPMDVMAARARAAVSPGSSPSLGPVDHHHGSVTLSPSQQLALVADASSSLKRPLGGSGSSQLTGLSAAMAAARRNTFLSSATTAAANNIDPHGPNKRPRMGSFAGYPPSPGNSSGAGAAAPVQPPPQGGGGRRGSKAKLRDDFWGKVGKNNSHIHLVNIVLGRLLHEQVRKAKFGNKVLSNGLIQQILDTKLYGKYAVRDFFASSNKGSETVRNTWTRLNFSSDDIRKGLSRYKEQTWQAIERCGFDKDVSDEDKAEMDEALKVFVKTHRFVDALNVALKGIITEEFIGVLMQLRLEWNGLCLNCRPEEHDAVVVGFLRKYGLNGK